MPFFLTRLSRSLQWAPMTRQIRWVSSPREVDLAEKKLPGTVAYHRRHLMLCTGTNQWPSHPEMAWSDRLFGKFTHIRRALTHAESPILFSLTDLPSVGKEGEDVLVFPEAIRLEALKISDVSRVEEFLTQPLSVPFQEALGGLKYSKLSGKYIFVCTHGERDCRCGEKGGKFHEALEHAVNQDTQIDGVSDVHVHRISHIGGHKYAANAILYPNGDWYGHLQVGQEYELLETLQKGQGMKEHWRGRIGLDKKEQEAQA